MAPKDPKKSAKKAAGQVAVKAADKKGAKAPFAKPLKAPAPKTKPESWTQKYWDADCPRRKYVTAERKGRRKAESLKKMAVANAAQVALLTACANAAAASPWSRSGTTYVPGSASLSMLGFFNDNGTATPRFSPHYADTLPHGGFNPNAMFFSPTYDERRQQSPNGDDGIANTPASASASTPATATASPALATITSTPAEQAEVVVLDGPSLTQEAPSTTEANPNLFF